MSHPRVVGFKAPNNKPTISMITILGPGALNSALRTYVAPPAPTVSHVNKIIQGGNLSRIRAALENPTLSGNNFRRLKKAYVARLTNSNRNTVRAALNSYPFDYVTRFHLLKKHGSPGMIMNALKYLKGMNWSRVHPENRGKIISMYSFNANQRAALMNAWALRKMNKRQIPNILKQLAGPGRQTNISRETIRALERI